ncbi:unnamed protein product [Linum tenue]|uniref:Uncharacterized protein n=1 Tax=Linum tenue TaxID=586396 RepID=A0AAV0IGH7_9ROSI|nr:unnamed protein product [Linum tenue]
MIFGLLMEALGVGDFIRRGVGGRVLESPFAGGSCARFAARGVGVPFIIFFLIMFFLPSQLARSNSHQRTAEYTSATMTIVRVSMNSSSPDFSQQWSYLGRFSGEFGAQDLDGHRWNCMGF